jgi:hypothetical protein
VFFYSKQLRPNATADANNETETGIAVPHRKLDYSAYRRKKPYQFNEYNFWSLCSGENHQVRQRETWKLQEKRFHTTSPGSYLNLVKP